MYFIPFMTSKFGITAAFLRSSLTLDSHTLPDSLLVAINLKGIYCSLLLKPGQPEYNSNIGYMILKTYQL